MAKKLRLCPDKSCEPLFLRGDDKHYDKGGSFMCWGKLEQESKLMFKEREHINGYCFCIGSPLKGIIRYFINPNDALICESGFHAVLLNHQKFLVDGGL